MKKTIGHKFDQQWQQTVVQGAAEFGITLNPAQIDMLTCHATELTQWNQKFNITAIVDPHEVAVKHFIDSIALCNHLFENFPDHRSDPTSNHLSDLSSNHLSDPVSNHLFDPIFNHLFDPVFKHLHDSIRVIDLGSGGGFPGIPLKIIKPSIEMVMVDASRKKVSFLKHMIRTIITNNPELESSGLNHSRMKALHVRAEQLGRDEMYAHRFDVVISRAFTSLAGFVEMALPFLNDTGFILAMKGNLTSEELAVLDEKEFNGGRTKGGHTKISREITRYLLPFENHRRCVVKIAPCPA